MADRDRWGLRGPVRSCRHERTWRANCGPNGSCDVEERGDLALLEFSADGTLARHWHQNPDGSQFASVSEFDANGRITSTETQNSNGPVTRRRYEYDDAGRLARIWSRTADAGEVLTTSCEYDPGGLKRKTVFIDRSAQREDVTFTWGVEGTDTFVSAPGATSMTTSYNERDQPVEVLFRDDGEDDVTRVVFTYDENGNLVEEAQTQESLWPPAEILADANPAQLDTLRTLLGTANAPIRRWHRYDERNRRIETQASLYGPIGRDRKTIAYNDHDDVIADLWESDHREFSVDDDGGLVEKAGSESATRSEARFNYEYDALGNWIVVTVESRQDPNAEFAVSTIERRTLVYYD
jgi:YD repeat-containing protein